MHFKFGRAALAAGIIAALSTGLAIAEDNAEAQAFQTPLVGSFARSAPAGDSFRMITWNIDRGYKFDGLVKVLQEKQPDLCLLQEVDLHARRTKDRDVGHDLAEALGYNYSFGREFQELGQGEKGKPAYQGQATLSRWPILKSRVLRFKRQSGWWKPHSFIPNTAFFQRRLGGRVALVTELSVNGVPVVVYNLHLESRSGGAIQHAQLDEVLADLKNYPPDTATIIGGDLNSKYHPTAVRHYLEKQGFQSVMGERLVRTHVIIGYLDWIFYRGPWKVEEGKVIRGSHASDHDPIFAELTVARNARASANR
jgi:endonuclease/exonuclease/phosphatase family metal-dependent hydrolase